MNIRSDSSYYRARMSLSTLVLSWNWIKATPEEKKIQNLLKKATPPFIRILKLEIKRISQTNDSLKDVDKIKDEWYILFCLQILAYTSISDCNIYWQSNHKLLTPCENGCVFSFGVVFTNLTVWHMPHKFYNRVPWNPFLVHM